MHGLKGRFCISAVGWSADRRLKGAGVVNLLASDGMDLGGGDFGRSDGPSVIGCEFDRVTAAAFIGVNHRSHITRSKPVFGEVSGQRHATQLFDRVRRDQNAVFFCRLTSATPHGKMQRCK